MRIGGIIDISTKDIPHKSAMVIFTVGCNFKCDYCHNKYLLQPNVGREYEISELMQTIKTNVLINGISISGGEPTLQLDLLELCKEITSLGKYISIDTNGSNPEVIKSIIPYINRVALDLKGPDNSRKLKKITGVNVNIKEITRTIKYINSRYDIDFEIRTTFVANLFTPEDINQIIDFLKKLTFRGNFVLQQYQFLEGVGEEFKRVFSKPEHDLLFNLLKPYRDIKLSFDIYLRDEIVGYCNINDL